MYERLRPPGFHAGSSCSEGPAAGEEGGCGVDIVKVNVLDDDLQFYADTFLKGFCPSFKQVIVTNKNLLKFWSRRDELR